jgi:ribosomal-protein-alanine N-acetyltransferase
MPVDPPQIVLQTLRLRLEVIQPQHREALFRLLTNPRVHRFFPHTPDEKQARRFYQQVMDRYQTDGHGFWAVIRKKDSRFLGICGLLVQIIDGIRETEVGYRFLDDFWGKGYGTEAARGCICHACQKRGLDSVISLIRPVNLASIRVAQKNKLQPEKEVLFHGLPHILYRLSLNPPPPFCISDTR